MPSATIAHPMQELLAESSLNEINLPNPGEFVNGKVISVHGNKILVGLGDSVIGLISGRETIDGLDTVKNLTVGDDIRAFVLEEENEYGYFVLSLRKAGREKAWKKYREMQKSGEPLEILIKEANRGGLTSELSGIRAFLPVSQLAPEHYPRVSNANVNEILTRLKKLIGKKLKVQIITADEENDKLIISEKVAVSKIRLAVLKNLKVGQKIKGKVSGITSFGLFLIFNDCLEGLIHLSEISWDKVIDPANHARIGEKKEAIVLDFDEKKIGLSIRRLTPDPWLKFIEEFEIGAEVNGKIVKITDYGALIELKKGLTALLHASKLEESGDLAKFKENEEIKVKIIAIDAKNHRISLGARDIVKIEEPAEKKKEVKDSAKDKKQKKEKDEKKEDNKKKLAQKEKKPTKEK